MAINDNFNLYLSSELKKSTPAFDNIYFKQRVLNNLPQKLPRKNYRNSIIYCSVILSCLVFLLLIDIIVIKNFIKELYLFLNKSILPSAELFIFILAITFILFFIPKLEFKQGLS